jgi:hypothetical protein
MARYREPVAGRVTCDTLRVISGIFFVYNFLVRLSGKGVQCDTSDTQREPGRHFLPA